MFYLLSLDEIRAECFGMSVWGHQHASLCVCMPLLSADWSFGIRPSTPKWTHRAAQEGHKHKQLMARLLRTKKNITIIHISLESFRWAVQQMHFKLLKCVSVQLGACRVTLLCMLHCFTPSLPPCESEADQLRNQKSPTAWKMDLCWVAC